MFQHTDKGMRKRGIRMSHLFHEIGVEVIPSAMHCHITNPENRSKGDSQPDFLSVLLRNDTTAQLKAKTPKILANAGEKCKQTAATTAKKAPAVCQGFSIPIF